MIIHTCISTHGCQIIKTVTVSGLVREWCSLRLGIWAAKNNPTAVHPNASLQEFPRPTWPHNQTLPPTPEGTIELHVIKALGGGPLGLKKVDIGRKRKRCVLDLATFLSPPRQRKCQWNHHRVQVSMQIPANRERGNLLPVELAATRQHETSTAPGGVGGLLKADQGRRVKGTKKSLSAISRCVRHRKDFPVIGHSHTYAGFPVSWW